MKQFAIFRFLLCMFMVVRGLAPSDQVNAQTFTALHNFAPFPSGGAITNGDGAVPYGTLVLSGNTLYGTTTVGGSSGNGTLFAVNTNGTGFTNLHVFTASRTNSFGFNTNSDGAIPKAGLLLIGTTLYGTTWHGGVSGRGAVFAANTDGTGFRTLHSFTETSDASGIHPYTNSDGAYPLAGLILSGSTLYGTTTGGGASGNGTVFSINTNGTAFATLHNFTATPSSFPYVNGDGANPYGPLLLSGQTLYGTTHYGGASGNGTIFAINTSGPSFTNLHSFAQSDGANPWSGLILSSNTLYGTTFDGGSQGNGTVFAINTNGTGFANLHSFTDPDGVTPWAGLTLLGNALYGAANGGGSSSNGTVFAVNTDGTGFKTVHNFNLVGDGAHPYAGLTLSGNTLYGSTLIGGSSSSGNGTVFSLSLPQASPALLTITPSGPKVILTWSANATGFTLQSTSNLVRQAIWSTVSPPPVVLNGLNTVTNPVSLKQQFYRLFQ